MRWQPFQVLARTARALPCKVSSVGNFGNEHFSAEWTSWRPDQEQRSEPAALSSKVTSNRGHPGIKILMRRSECWTILRQFMAAYLDDHPEAVLQLTGGQDSRILLSAIPPQRRRGLKVMTLGVAGSADVAIAAGIAERYSMVHQVESLGGLEGLTPDEAFRLCVQASQRLECMADPLAFAALSWAESKFDQEPRLSGLGGEVARGFYYFGPMRDASVSRRRVAQLANWRLFANEAVSSEALAPGFAAWSREFTLGEVLGTISGTGLDWFSATDEFDLEQRMQRWAGVTDTAVCFDREVTNPMLDNRFLDIARGLPSRCKRGARFLGQLQVELDEQLANLPLDGRPPPSAYAYGGLANSARLASTSIGKAARKARQRLSRENRPPAGGEVLCAEGCRVLARSPRGNWISSVT